MSEPHQGAHGHLSSDERAILVSALREPVVDRDPMIVGICLRLCARHLLQRAGGVAAANGWRGSPAAFVLTRQGWTLLKVERRGPIRRTG